MAYQLTITTSMGGGGQPTNHSSLELSVQNTVHISLFGKPTLYTVHSGVSVNKHYVHCTLLLSVLIIIQCVDSTQ